MWNVVFYWYFEYTRNWLSQWTNIMGSNTSIHNIDISFTMVLSKFVWLCEFMLKCILLCHLSIWEGKWSKPCKIALRCYVFMTLYIDIHQYLQSECSKYACISGFVPLRKNFKRQLQPNYSDWCTSSSWICCNYVCSWIICSHMHFSDAVQWLMHCSRVDDKMHDCEWVMSDVGTRNALLCGNICVYTRVESIGVQHVWWRVWIAKNNVLMFVQ